MTGLVTLAMSGQEHDGLQQFQDRVVRANLAAWINDNWLTIIIERRRYMNLAGFSTILGVGGGGWKRRRV